MKEMAAGAFKGRCLRVMDEVRATRQPVVITKRGRPVATLVPADQPPPRLFGCLAGIVEIAGAAEFVAPTAETTPASPAGGTAAPDDWKVW